MFFGNYPGTLDEKGRVHIPSIFAKQVKGDFMVVLQWGEALAAFPGEQFERLANRLEEEAKESKDAKKLERARNIFQYSFSGTFKNGKLLVPQELRTVINHDNKLKIIGIKDKIEIWSEAVWLKQQKPVDGKTMRDGLDDFGLL
jgi:MraZ protein